MWDSNRKIFPQFSHSTESEEVHSIDKMVFGNYLFVQYPCFSQNMSSSPTSSLWFLDNLIGSHTVLLRQQLFVLMWSYLQNIHCWFCEQVWGMLFHIIVVLLAKKGTFFWHSYSHYTSNLEFMCKYLDTKVSTCQQLCRAEISFLGEVSLSNILYVCACIRVAVCMVITL